MTQPKLKKLLKILFKKKFTSLISRNQFYLVVFKKRSSTWIYSFRKIWQVITKSVWNLSGGDHEHQGRIQARNIFLETLYKIDKSLRRYLIERFRGYKLNKRSNKSSADLFWRHVVKKFGFVEIVASTKKFVISECRTADKHVTVHETVLRQCHKALEASIGADSFFKLFKSLFVKFHQFCKQIKMTLWNLQKLAFELNLDLNHLRGRLDFEKKMQQMIEDSAV